MSKIDDQYWAQRELRAKAELAFSRGVAKVFCVALVVALAGLVFAVFHP